MLNNLKSKVGNEIFQDFLRKLFAMTAMLYLIFFGLETILPGLIIDIFNFNFLLFLALGSLALMLFGAKEEKVDWPVLNSKAAAFFTFAIIFLSLVLMVALYKVSLLESFFYLVLTLIVGILLWKRF